MNGLSFYHPSYLWALGLVAIPLIIHLLSRRRTKRVLFSSLQFFQTSAVRTSSRRRLRRILLLLTRMGIFAVLIILFAQPYDDADPFTVFRDPNATHYLWIDQTPSMEYRKDNGERLIDVADGFARKLDSTLRSPDRLLLFDEESEEFVPFEEVTADGPLSVRHGEPSISRARDLFHDGTALSNEKGRFTLTIFSDFQRDVASEVDSIMSGDTLGFPLLLVPLGDPEAHNYSLSAKPGEDDAAIIGAKIRSYGKELPKTELTVEINGTRVGHSRVSAQADDSALADIEISSGLSGREGVVLLERNDPMQFDNRSYFAANVDEKIRILLVSEPENTVAVSAALGALSEDKRRPVVRTPSTVTYDDVDSADVVVIGNVRSFAGGLQALTSGSVFDSKAILFSPVIDPAGFSVTENVLRRLGSSSPRIERSETALHPVLPDTVSSLWKGFPRTFDKDVAVYEYVTPLPGDPLLYSGTRIPLVTKITDENGHVWILFATPLGIGEANTLAESGFYVPMLDRLIRYAVAAVGKSGRQWIAGSWYPNPFHGRRTTASVYDAAGDLVDRWHSQMHVRLETPGHYTIRPEGAPAYGITVGSDPMESNVAYSVPNPGERNAHFLRVLHAGGFLEFARKLNRPRRFDLLWVLLAVFVLAEILLWDRRSGKTNT